MAQNGTVQVPYAGRLKLAGLRPGEAEALIVESLKGKAIEPQAVVTITKNRNNTVTVTGEVTNGMLAPVSVKGDRVLDVVASAGGLRAARRRRPVSTNWPGGPASPSELRADKGRLDILVPSCHLVER